MKKTSLLILLVLAGTSLLAQSSAPAGDGAPPLHLGIVLRASKTTFPWQQAAATELIRQLVRNPGDEAFVITAGGDHPWPYERLDWDSNPESLTKFIKGLKRDAGMPEPFKFEIQTSQTAEAREYLTKYDGAPAETSFFAIVAAMMKSDPKPARRVMIMFRDPWDHSPGWGSSYAQYVDRRHDYVISLLKDAGVATYIVGIADVSTRPQVTSDIGSTYAPAQSGGSGGMLRVFDENFRKEIDHLTNAGRANLERIAKDTNGGIVYSDKKNYSDAVPDLVAKIGVPTPTASVGK